MNLIRKTYDTTEVQITSFQSSKGITEYHIFFQQTNCLEGTAFPLLRTINRTAGSDERHEDCIVGLAADWRTDTGVAKWVV